MSEQGLHYDDLSADAKGNALKSFINYYVDQYRNGSLEILGSKVDNGPMGTINEMLHLNAFMGHGELVNVSYQFSKPAYVEILEQLKDVLYRDDGTPVVNWEDAWEKQEEQLPSED